MFVTATPESVGIPSEKVLAYLETLQKKKYSMHSVLIARGNQIICEAYWKPFHKDFLHRMYSQTKSYVGIAVGELAAEGRINLDDPIIKYFPDKLPKIVHPYLQAQTIRNMLHMQTCMGGDGWFAYHPKDRVEHYFHRTPERYPGTTFSYDSTGSFVLGALVERISGMKFLDYLREKCLDKIGFSKEAYCLQLQGGYSWGDSALLCTSRDMLSFLRLLANQGKWNGEQLLDKNNVIEATKKQVDNAQCPMINRRGFGYGHQIWRMDDESFSFFGMYNQMSLYHPKTDLLFVCTGNNMDEGLSLETIFPKFYELIVDSAKVQPLAENPQAYQKLCDYCEQLELVTTFGEEYSEFEKTIHQKRFVADDNPMKITEFSLSFDKDGGSFRYLNDQGEKVLRFGRCKNVFQKFPQTGYSDEIGNTVCEGHMYDCAVSAAWREDKKLAIFVQINDKYFATLYIVISFRDNHAVIEMKRAAEDMLNEYEGYLTAEMQ